MGFINHSNSIKFHLSLLYLKGLKYKKTPFDTTDNILRRELIRIKDPLLTHDQSSCIYRTICKDHPIGCVGKIKVMKYDGGKSRLEEKVTIIRLEHDSRIALHGRTKDSTTGCDKVSILHWGLANYTEILYAESLTGVHFTFHSRKDGADVRNIGAARASLIDRLTLIDPSIMVPTIETETVYSCTIHKDTRAKNRARCSCTLNTYMHTYTQV